MLAIQPDPAGPSATKMDNVVIWTVCFEHLCLHGLVDFVGGMDGRAETRLAPAATGLFPRGCHGEDVLRAMEWVW